MVGFLPAAPDPLRIALAAEFSGPEARGAARPAPRSQKEADDEAGVRRGVQNRLGSSFSLVSPQPARHSFCRPLTNGGQPASFCWSRQLPQLRVAGRGSGETHFAVIVLPLVWGVIWRLALHSR